MNIFSRQFIKKGGTFKKEVSFEVVRAHDDWKEILMLSLVLLGCVALVSGFLFFYIQRDDAFQVGDEGATTVLEIDKRALERVLETIATKEERMQMILESERRLVDPSL